MQNIALLESCPISPKITRIDAYGVNNEAKSISVVLKVLRCMQ